MGVAERQVQRSVPVQEAKSVFDILNTTFKIGSLGSFLKFWYSKCNVGSMIC